MQPPLSLPQTLRGTVRVPVSDDRSGAPRPSAPVDTLRALYPALAACWRAPDGLAGLERTEITTRFSLRRDGSLIGTPRVTFSSLPNDTRARTILTDATLAAIRRYTPVEVTPGLGAAIAGRPLALRFVYTGPRGQGI